MLVATLVVCMLPTTAQAMCNAWFITRNDEQLISTRMLLVARIAPSQSLHDHHWSAL